MTRQKAFQTAAARRRADPIEWIIDDRVIKLKASAELTEIVDVVEALTEPIDDSKSELRGALEKRGMLLEILKTFIEPGSHQAFDDVAPDIDFFMLQEMMQDLVMEYTGQNNPTQAPSSSDGSLTTGNSSTDGAQDEASIQ